MYPYFIIQWHKIYAVWVGIVISLLFTIIIAWYFAKKHRLQFSKFFNWLPIAILLSYILWNRAWLIFDQGIRFPFKSWKIFLSLLSPYWYNFHFVWLIIWGVIAWHQFFKKIYLKTEMKKWVNTFFFAFAAGLIPLWIFLLLGDTFVGKPTDARYGVQALLNDSILTNYGAVLPIGLMISIFGFLSYVFILFCNRFFSQEKVWGYLWFAILFFLFNIVFIWETYVRHAVIDIGNYSLDIKNYITTFIALYFLLKFFRSHKQQSNYAVPQKY